MPFEDIGPEEDLPQGALRRVTVAGRAVALFRTAEGCFAFEDRCPHAGAPLSEGAVRDGHVVCAWHGFKFEAGTGACPLYPGAPSAAVVLVKVEAGRILVGDGT